MAAELLAILGLVLINGVFAGAEIAVLALRKTRLDQLVAARARGALAVVALREQPERFLATVQIGITVIGATAAAFGGAAFAERLAPTIAQFEPFAQSADRVAVAIVVVGVSFLSLVLGELVPKSLALKFGEQYALRIAGPLSMLASAARPVVWFLTATSNLFLRPFGDRTTFTEARLSADELRQLLVEASRTGALGARSADIASRAIGLEKLTAGDVMVPRNRIVAIDRDSPQQEIERVFATAGHLRIPVYERDLDHIVGFLSSKDVLARVVKREPFRATDLLRPVLFVPDIKAAPAVLQRMQREHAVIAMVVNEFGAVTGLITIDDLVDELVGVILREGEVGTPEAVRQPDGTVIAQGATPLHELERLVSLTFPRGDYSTLAGLCIWVAGKIPAPGETFVLDDGTKLEVLEATARQVSRVRVIPKR